MVLYTAVAQHNPKIMSNCLLVSIGSPIRRENGDKDLLQDHLEEKDIVLTSHTLIDQNLAHLSLYQLKLGENKYLKMETLVHPLKRWTSKCNNRASFKFFGGFVLHIRYN